jgi:hypothetical protein
VQQESLSIRLYVYSGKLILAAMYLRKIEIDGRSYMAAPTQVSTVLTPPAPAAQNLSVGLRRPYSADLLGAPPMINASISLRLPL